MRPRHIVAIPSWYDEGRGSGGGYFRDQALALQAAGHRVAMLVPEIYTARDLRAGRAPTEERLVRDDGGLGVYRQARRMRLPRLPYRNALVWSQCGLGLFATYAAANGMPDLVHAQSCLNAGALAALIKARHGVPFIVSEHSTGFAQDRLRWWERDLVRRVAWRAAARIAVSPHLAALLAAQFPGTAWEYVPNILGDAFLQPIAAKRMPADAVGFAFLCAARLAPVKNHALLIDAFADAFSGDPQTRLHLAGDGPIRRQLEELCAVRGVASQVAFLGRLSAERLRAAMERADAFVLASDVETFGVVVIEAQSTGLPVVCTASGGPDHLVEAQNGALVPVGDRAALREALLAMRQRAHGYDRVRISVETIRRFGPAEFAARFSEIADASRQSAPFAVAERDLQRYR